MAGSSSILLRGGTVLEHGEADVITPRRADVLIIGNRISDIAVRLQPPAIDTKIIDCRNKIITPGFVDTHRHMWQTQLKGRHGNHNLGEYMPSGHLTGNFFTERDVFLGTLGAGAESIDAGTTTVVDHAHVALSPPHVRQAINALVASGLRGFFCLAPTTKVEAWKPVLKTNDKFIQDWFVPLMKTLADEMPLANGRIQLGLGFDGFHLPREEVVDLYKTAQKLQVKLFTSHHFHAPVSFNAIEPLADYGLLGPDVLLSHATGITKSETDIVLAAGAHISSTPSTELQMGLGEPVCFEKDLSRISSLGVDCHSATSASLVNEARLALQHFRALRNGNHWDQDPTEFASIGIPVVDAFNLITINGARAIGAGSELGQVRVGMLADLLVWDTWSPAMIAAAQHDPVTAILLHSSPQDLDTVIIDGVLRKKDGKLEPFELDVGPTEWRLIATEISNSREILQQKIATTVV